MKLWVMTSFTLMWPELYACNRDKTNLWRESRCDLRGLFTNGERVVWQRCETLVSVLPPADSGRERREGWVRAGQSRERERRVQLRGDLSLIGPNNQGNVKVNHSHSTINVQSDSGYWSGGELEKRQSAVAKFDPQTGKKLKHQETPS